MLLPLVVSMEGTASISGKTSRAFISSTPTGETMNSTGWWGRVGASGQMWVEMITSRKRVAFHLHPGDFERNGDRGDRPVAVGDEADALGPRPEAAELADDAERASGAAA